MDYVTALTGQGGWPMTVFATPEGKPFYAGTYFPPRPSSGRPSFGQVLEAIGETWRDRRSDVEEAAGRIGEQLADRGDRNGLWRTSSHCRAGAPQLSRRSGGRTTAPDLVVRPSSRRR